MLAIDLERTGAHPEADCKILIKDSNLDSLVDQERQVLQEAQVALDGKFRFQALNNRVLKSILITSAPSLRQKS